MKHYILFLLLIFTSCSIDQSDILGEFTITRPYFGNDHLGYDRNVLFPNYLSFSSFANFNKTIPLSTRNTRAKSYFCRLTEDRKNWNPTSLQNFRRTYPSFNIQLLVFNQFSVPNNFTWQERIILGDALELAIMAINNPVFEEEMRKLTFTENDGRTPLSQNKVINSIKQAAFSVIFSKNTLPPSVAAEATIGGISHTIWFRNDKDYSKYNVIELAVILGHELTHNLGYKHSSGVPYGVHIPILLAIHRATEDQIRTFIRHTPSREEQFLSQVRFLSFRSKRTASINTKAIKIQEIGLEENIQEL
ncbi:MAG: hypothetical protein ACRCTJ_04795, partial [Brevinema sp.]